MDSMTAESRDELLAIQMVAQTDVQKVRYSEYLSVDSKEKYWAELMVVATEETKVLYWAATKALYWAKMRVAE